MPASHHKGDGDLFFHFILVFYVVFKHTFLQSTPQKAAAKIGIFLKSPYPTSSYLP